MNPQLLKESPLVLYVLILSVIVFMVGIWTIVSTNKRMHGLMKRYRNLIQYAGTTDLDSVCDLLATRLERVEKKLDSIAQAYTVMAEDELCHMRTVKVVRYNAFERQGGEQSFSMAMLDARRNGMILTNICGSLENRVYAKPVKDGTSEIALSPEEKQVLEDALKG